VIYGFLKFAEHKNPALGIPWAGFAFMAPYALRADILSDIRKRVYRAAVYDYLEVEMRTCDVAGAADSRYRLSRADTLSDADGDRACEAVGVSCLDSAAVVDDDAVTVARIASAHALDRSV
jgi:hypothetical protein